MKKHPKHGIEMKKAPIIKFLRKIINDPTVELEVKFYTDKSFYSYGALANWSDDDKFLTIKINKSLSKGRDLKDLLLHEVGHLKGKDHNNPSIVEKELSAQIWAIQRAKELKMNKQVKSLEWELQERWSTQNYDWNSPYRRYILASKLAKKRKLI